MNKENENPLSTRDILILCNPRGAYNTEDIIYAMQKYAAQQCAEKDKEIENLKDELSAFENLYKDSVNASKYAYEILEQKAIEKDKKIERLADQMNVDTEKIIAFDETIRKYELLKQKADKLCYSAKGLRDYFMFFIKDPKFNEFINIVEAITSYEKQE